MQRRGFLTALARGTASVAAVTGIAGCLGGGAQSATGGSGNADGSSGADGEYDGWFEGVSNYDGTVDETGNSTVTVDVGTQANGAGMGFGPAAVEVSTGTTVIWEWTGAGGTHNVVDDGGTFESEYARAQGHTFEHTFAETGTYTYYCQPHLARGMKGAVRVVE